MYDVIIVGAGVVGAMIARELCKYRMRVCVLEKENDVARGASGANSGIIHGGYDPVPGTLKAKLNSEAVEKLCTAAQQLHVPYLMNGSMVCAFNVQEDRAIERLYLRGQTSHIRGLEILSGNEAREIEPNLSPDITSVLLVRNAGIICPYQLTIAAMGNAMDNGADLRLNFEIVNIQRKNGVFRIRSNSGDTVSGRLLINCAGGCSDRVAAMAGDQSFRIIPRSGEYMLLDKSEGCRVKHTIFRVPSSEGKGILVSPTVDGNLLLGPTANEVPNPLYTQTTTDGLNAVRIQATASVPSVNLNCVITSFCGIRASVKDGDFIINFSNHVSNLINVAAIDSPGLTCCVAIAEYVVQLMKEKGIVLENRLEFDPCRKDCNMFQKMTDDEKNEYIQNHPQYGRIVCRCEQISEGEILLALRMNPAANDVDGVKRRTRSGMGRCQGGFCGAAVMKLIAQEKGIPVEQVTKNGDGSNIVMGRRNAE